MSNTFFISDTHFGHSNILAYDNRPFTSINEHDDALIEGWNSVVGIYDNVYLLGDVSWHNTTKTNEILDKLNGRKYLIIGNHDSRLLKNNEFRSKFVNIEHYMEIQYRNTDVVLSHYPIPCYKNHFYGWYHLYGHVHNSFEYNMTEHFQTLMRDLYSKESRMYNVGCMMSYMNYKPKTIEQIISGYNEDNGK